MIRNTDPIHCNNETSRQVGKQAGISDIHLDVPACRAHCQKWHDASVVSGSNIMLCCCEEDPSRVGLCETVERDAYTLKSIVSSILTGACAACPVSRSDVPRQGRQSV